MSMTLGQKLDELESNLNCDAFKFKFRIFSRATHSLSEEWETFDKYTIFMSVTVADNTGTNRLFCKRVAHSYLGSRYYRDILSVCVLLDYRPLKGIYPSVSQKEIDMYKHYVRKFAHQPPDGFVNKIPGYEGYEDNEEEAINDHHNGRPRVLGATGLELPRDTGKTGYQEDVINIDKMWEAHRRGK